MYLYEIELNNFRNYTAQHVTFHPKVNIITGDNAQGKTNLLEAIYIMSLGKSFRTNKDTEMIGFNKPYALVKSVTLKNEEPLEIEIRYMDKQKQIKIDGVSIQKNIDLLEHVYTVIFSPEDLKIVKGEPEKRRKFIDRELCQLKPIYYKNLGRYKKIIQHRNTLLKKQEIDQHVLEVWNEELAEYGSKIILERSKFITKLNEISQTLHEKITDGREHLEIHYEASLPTVADIKEQKKIFLELLNKNIKNDIFHGNTSVGPHKDDLKISVNEIDIRRFGSQGQQRTAALSLKLAELSLIKEETGEDAILLLDDVLSELDGKRQSFLLNRLKETQIFITTAEIGQTLLKNMPEGFVFEVKNGIVKSIENGIKTLT